MAAMDLLGRRWTLRVLWELRSGPVGARALLAACEGLSSSVLYERLRELTDASLVVLADRYAATTVLTLDRRDFDGLARSDGTPLTVLP